MPYFWICSAGGFSQKNHIRFTNGKLLKLAQLYLAQFSAAKHSFLSILLLQSFPILPCYIRGSFKKSCDCHRRRQSFGLKPPVEPTILLMRTPPRMIRFFGFNRKEINPEAKVPSRCHVYGILWLKKILYLLNRKHYFLFGQVKDSSASFAIFSKTFFRKPLVVLVIVHMFAKHDQFCKQQTVFKVSKFAITSLLNLGSHWQ